MTAPGAARSGRGRLRLLVKVVLTLAVIGLAAWYVLSHADDFSFVRNMDPSQLALLAVLSLIYLGCHSAAFGLSLTHYGVRLRIWETVGLIFSTSFINLVMPMGGIGIRVAYLNQVHGLAIRSYVITQTAVLSIELFVYALGGLPAVLVQPAFTPAAVMVTAIMAATVAGAVFAYFLSPRLLPGRFVLMERLRAMIGDWQSFCRDRRLVGTLHLVTAAHFLVFGAIYKTAFAALGAECSWSMALVVAAASEFAYFLRITPGGLGTFEGTVVLAGNAVGIAVPQALVVAMLVRLGSVLWFVIIGPLFSHRLLRCISR